MIAVGLSLRPAWIDALRRCPRRAVDVLEVMIDDVIHAPRRPVRELRALARRWPVLAHGVALGIGGLAPGRIVETFDIKSQNDSTKALLVDMTGFLVSDYADIGEQLGVAEGTSKARLFRARRMLRDELAEFAEEYA